MQSRLTLNVNCSYVKDWGNTLRFLRALDPVAVIAVIDTRAAKPRVLELKAALPHAKIIVRCIIVVEDNGQKKELDGGMHLAPQGAGDTNHYIVSPGNFLNTWGELGQGGLTLSYMNEPQTSDASDENIRRQVQHMIETINLATQRGISLLVGNWGVGQSPNEVKREQWDARFDDVLILISRHPELFTVGIHQYAPVDTYHALDGLIARCEAKAIPKVPCIISEFGFDSDGNANSLNGYKSRGQSGVQFGGWCVDKIKNLYRPYFQDGTLEAVAVFGWGYAASFPNFDVETDIDWQSTILAAKDKGDLTTETTLPTPIPHPAPAYAPTAIIAGKKYTLQSKGGERTNVHSSPVVALDNKLGKALDDKTIATVFEVQQAGFDWWYRISTGDITNGWVSGRGGDLYMTPVPTTGELPPPANPLPVPAPFLEISSERAIQMAKAYRTLSASYLQDSEASKRAAEASLLLSQDMLTLAQTWDDIAQQTGKQAA